jgi:acyl-CoA thioesterase-1
MQLTIDNRQGTDFVCIAKTIYQRPFAGGLLLVMLLLLMASCGTNNSKEPPAADNDQLPAEQKDSSTSTTAGRNIVFFGNSLTAGYGVDPTEAFPAVIQEKLDSLQLPYKVINAGVSGETTAGGNSRIAWILRQPIDVFVLELGGNDGLRGIPITETQKNLQQIIDKVKEKYPSAKIVLAGMEVPPNMGSRYAGKFREIFRELAKKNHVPLIPFLLEDVGGVPELNQPDGIHPTPGGHKIVARNVWEVLDDVLQDR